jgi:hypothetical protein
MLNSSVFKPLIEEIKNYKKIRILLKESDASSQRYHEKSQTVQDRFVFVIPYCQKELTCKKITYFSKINIFDLLYFSLTR